MSDKATLTDEQIAEYEAIFKENRPVISQWSIGLKVIAALRASQERVKELESIMTIWNQEELDEAEKRAEMTKTLFDQAERVAVLEEVAEAAEAFFKMPFNPLNTNYINPLEGAALSDALKKAGYLK